MLTLAIEAATPVAGIAILENERLLYEQYIDYKKTHSETLMPMIDLGLKICERESGAIDLIAVSAGPGSFTGLRIGMATAKGLALATGARIIGVSTLQAMACNAASERGLICPVLDARKNEVYTGIFEIQGGVAVPVAEERAMHPESMGAWLRAALDVLNQDKLCFLGSGYEAYGAIIAAGLGVHSFNSLPPQLMNPRASAAGLIAYKQSLLGISDDVYSLEPRYIRKSEAEYKLEQKADQPC